MGGKSKSPKAPDYTGLAQQQSNSERAAANDITQANRPTQQNPYGSIQWSKDANGNWVQNETWDPRIQNMSDQNLGMQERFMQEAQQQGKFTGPDAVKYDPNSGQQTADALYKSVMDRANVTQARDRSALDTQLKQQGLQPGTEAYDRAMKNMLTAQGDVDTQAALNAQLAGGNEARANFGAETTAQQNEYNQKMGEYRLPWEQLATAQGANSAIPKPQFAGFSGATGYQPADLLNARQKQYETEMGGSNSGNAKKGNLMGSALGTVASIWGGK